MTDIKSCNQENATFPKAEYDVACKILMYTPEDELFDGVVHYDAALYDDYFEVDAAKSEHEGYIRMLRANGIEVVTVKDVLLSMPHEKLQALADPYLTYDASATSQTPAQTELYRQHVLAKMSNADLVRVLMRHPKVVLRETGFNTGLAATYQHEPLMNMFYCRDQSINTPRGQVMCKMNSSQRSAEVDIVEACYHQLGYEPVYRISGEDSFLEGGDYIPFGDYAFIGQGLRTTQGAIDEMLEHDVIGHDTLVVVRDHWCDQYQMHLDTYFNVIDKDLATLCYNRYDAKPGDDHFLTVDVYTREPGTKKYHVDEKYAGMSFMEFLAEKGIHVIRICKEDANHYANNYLTINARHIMSVANQSKELAAEYERLGVKVEWVPLENLICGYGAAHCMTQVILRK